MVIKTMSIKKQQNVKYEESLKQYLEERTNKLKMMGAVVIPPQETITYNDDPLQFVPNVIDRDTTIDNITLKAQLIAVYYYADSGYSDTEYDNNTNKTTDYADYDCTY